MLVLRTDVYVLGTALLVMGTAYHVGGTDMYVIKTDVLFGRSNHFVLKNRFRPLGEWPREIYKWGF